MDNLPKSFNNVDDFVKFQRENMRRAKEMILPELYDAFYKKRWNDFINCALCKWQVMPEAFALYDEIPDKYKYDFAIAAYQHHGDSIPAVRKAVRGARKYGKPILPEDIAALDEITVYRAGEEVLSKCKYRLSWTTSKEVALFFLDWYGGRHARYLYCAKIRPADIIAYTDERKEKEVIQYAKVYDITLLEER